MNEPKIKIHKPSETKIQVEITMPKTRGGYRRIFNIDASIDGLRIEEIIHDDGLLIRVEQTNIIHIDTAA